MTQTVHVAVAVILNSDDQVCLSLRHEDAHQGGLWEFPGGKVEDGEQITSTLKREIKEELDISVTGSRPLITISHDYGDKAVCLHVHKVTSFAGEARGMEGQEVRWVDLSDLGDYAFPSANSAIVKAVRLPDKYLITGGFDDADEFTRKLNAALNNGVRLVQLRIKQVSDIPVKTLQTIIDTAGTSCQQHGASLMLNVTATLADQLAFSDDQVSGFHCDSRTLMSLEKRPAGRLFSASCHDREELARAQALGADFVVLSPVQETSSHPGQPAMGWQAFDALVETATIPVYALGGVTEKDLEMSWSHGAQGIAAISALWK